MADDKTKKLLQMKEQVEQAHSKADKLRGSLDELKKRFKEYGCKDRDEAQKKLDEMDESLAKSEKERDAGIAELEKAYSWS